MKEAVAALRELAAARHIGKIVLQAHDSLPQPLRASPDGRWIITGGTGALGALAGELVPQCRKRNRCKALSAFVQFIQECLSFLAEPVASEEWHAASTLLTRQL